MNALLIVIGLIIGIPLAIYAGMVIFAVFGVTLAVVISAWPLLVGVPIGILVSNAGHTGLGVLIIIGSIVGEFIWLNYYDREKSTDSQPRLPGRFVSEVASFSEGSHRAVRVTLVLRDGRRIQDVVIGADVICKIGQKQIESETDLDFSVTDIKDVQRA